jgi:D-glycero-alpha-D-manno-heptose-7-phosphate kinase
MRIDFAGGWTDTPQYADRVGGVVVNGAISLHVRVDFLLGDRRIRLRAEDLGERASFASSGSMKYDGNLDLHKAALNMFPVTGGIEILSRSDAPSGSGLGASGALDVALLAGLARCRQEDYSAEELAELGFELETRELQLLGGRQDQYAAALGGFHQFAFSADGIEARRLQVDAEAARDLADHLVLAYTGHSHFSSATHQRVWSAFESGDQVVTEALHAIRELAPSAKSALEAGNWRDLAKVVSENWGQQQRLDATIATESTRRIERAVVAAGAWGLKATGAGAGGCVTILCPPTGRVEVVRAAEATGATILDVEFVPEGVEVREEEDALRSE